MADMTPLDDILNGADASATPVQNNFQTIETYINSTNLVRTDGTEVMTADLDMGGNSVTNDGLGLQGNWTGTQAVTGASADVDFDIEVYDIGSTGAVGSNTFTAPGAGLYSFTWVSSSSGENLQIVDDAGMANANVTSSASTSTDIQYLTNAQVVAFTSNVSDGVGSETLTFDLRVIRLS